MNLSEPITHLCGICDFCERTPAAMVMRAYCHAPLHTPITHFCGICGFCERLCAGGKKKCPIHED